MGGRGSGRHDHAIRVVAGEQLGQLTVLADLEPDPQRGKRARYRCSCGATVDRVCYEVRLQRRRIEARAARRGLVPWGPSCRACIPDEVAA
jgi:hypothetical protein